MLWSFVTYEYYSRRQLRECVSIAIVRVSDYNKTKTAETKNRQTWHSHRDSRYLVHQWILSQKVKVTLFHKVQKGDRVAGVS